MIRKQVPPIHAAIIAVLWDFVEAGGVDTALGAAVVTSTSPMAELRVSIAAS